LFADERTLIKNAETPRAVLCVRSLTPVANHDQARLHSLFQNPRKDLDAVNRSLNRPKI
jgi:hypothetical protein